MNKLGTKCGTSTRTCSENFVGNVIVLFLLGVKVPWNMRSFGKYGLFESLLTGGLASVPAFAVFVTKSALARRSMFKLRVTEQFRQETVILAVNKYYPQKAMPKCPYSSEHHFG